MKKIAVIALSMLVASSVLADDVKFVNSDGSSVGDLCIAAIGSTSTLDFLAKELNIAPVDVDSVVCNGKPIRSFARQHRQENSQDPAYVISVADQTPETQVCIAALTSDAEFERLVADHFGGDMSSVQETMQCNGLSVRQFVRKYRDSIAAMNEDASTASR